MDSTLDRLEVDASWGDHETGGTRYLADGPAPSSLDEALAALQLEDLPNRLAWEEPVLNMLKGKLSTLASIFCHYCKHGGSSASIATACRLKLGQPCCRYARAQPARV